MTIDFKSMAQSFQTFKGVVQIFSEIAISLSSDDLAMI